MSAWIAHEYNDGWHVFDGLGCEIWAESKELAEYMAKYFNEHNISGNAPIDEHICNARQEFKISKQTELLK